MCCYGQASADILGGEGNDGAYGPGCSGTVSHTPSPALIPCMLMRQVSGMGNKVTISGLGKVTIAGQATATVSSAGNVYVRSGVRDVSLASGATATMGKLYPPSLGTR